MPDTAPVAIDMISQTIERFWETIPPLWNEVRGRIRTVATDDFGISVEQFQILRHIRKGVRSVSDLAEAKQISRPAISQAVDILVEKGLISRRQSPEDRRFVELELTPHGDELLNAIFQKNRGWMREKLASLDAGELTCVLCAMDRLGQAFDLK